MKWLLLVSLLVLVLAVRAAPTGVTKEQRVEGRERMTRSRSLKKTLSSGDSGSSTPSSTGTVNQVPPQVEVKVGHRKDDAPEAVIGEIADLIC
jgi:hypothetical protein